MEEALAGGVATEMLSHPPGGPSKKPGPARPRPPNTAAHSGLHQGSCPIMSAAAGRRAAFHEAGRAELPQAVGSHLDRTVRILSSVVGAARVGCVGRGRAQHARAEHVKHQLARQALVGVGEGVHTPAPTICASRFQSRDVQPASRKLGCPREVLIGLPGRPPPSEEVRAMLADGPLNQGFTTHSSRKVNSSPLFSSTKYNPLVKG